VISTILPSGNSCINDHGQQSDPQARSLATNLFCAAMQISAIFTEYQAAAAGGATVPQGLARRMDGALLAVGALSDILKQKVHTVSVVA